MADIELVKHINSEIRSEIRLILEQNHKLSLTCLTSYAIIIAFVISMIDKNLNFLTISLVFVPLPFLGLWYTFIGRYWGIVTMSNYLIEHIEPFMSVKESSGFIPWETYLRKKVKPISRLIQQGFWPLGQGVLFILPILASDIFFIYLNRLKNVDLANIWIIIYIIQLIFTVVVISISILSIKYGLKSIKNISNSDKSST